MTSVDQAVMTYTHQYPIMAHVTKQHLSFPATSVARNSITGF